MTRPILALYGQSAWAVAMTLRLVQEAVRGGQHQEIVFGVFGGLRRGRWRFVDYRQRVHFGDRWHFDTVLGMYNFKISFADFGTDKGQLFSHL